MIIVERLWVLESHDVSSSPGSVIYIDHNLSEPPV